MNIRIPTSLSIPSASATATPSVCCSQRLDCRADSCLSLRHPPAITPGDNAPATAAPKVSLSKLPLYFIENQGRACPVAYYLHG